jgi:hypothetical protein
MFVSVGVLLNVTSYYCSCKVARYFRDTQYTPYHISPLNTVCAYIILMHTNIIHFNFNKRFNVICLFVFVYSTTLYGTHATFLYFKHCVLNCLSKISYASITLCDAFTVFSVVTWMITFATEAVCERKLTAGKVSLLLTVT